MNAFEKTQEWLDIPACILSTLLCAERRAVLKRRLVLTFGNTNPVRIHVVPRFISEGLAAVPLV